MDCLGVNNKLSRYPHKYKLSAIGAFPTSFQKGSLTRASDLPKVSRSSPSDIDDELKEFRFLGFFGIYKQAFKITYSWGKIFSQIFLALIPPLSVLALVDAHISTSLWAQILALDVQTPLDANSDAADQQKIIINLVTKIIAFFLFKAAYFIATNLVYAISSSVTANIIACKYSGKDQMTFRKTTAVLPKVWKRLLVTYVLMVFIIFAYHFIWFFLATLIWIISGPFIVAEVAFAVYLGGWTYTLVVWHLARVVSALEDSCGLSAIIRSKNLINGKLFVISTTLIAFQILYYAMEVSVGMFVVNSKQSGFGAARIMTGLMLLLPLCLLNLLGLVIDSIVYFVCKTYHHESID